MGSSASYTVKKEVFHIKYLRLLILLLVLVFILSDCGSTRAPYNVYVGDKKLTIHPQAGTITHGKDIYRYNVKTVWGGKCYELTYPGGQRCSWTESKKTGQGSWSEGYGPTIYLSGETLVEALKKPAPENHKSYWIKQGNPVHGIVCIVGGFVIMCLHKCVPKSNRIMVVGRYGREVTPEEMAGINFAEGILMVIAGLLMCFF
jgi:hypothetical protein